MAVRPDVRLDDGPMHPVACTTCGARVQARKASWDQTTVQWSEQAAQTCHERGSTAERSGPNGATFLGCSALVASVREAAVSGELPVDETRDDA